MIWGPFLLALVLGLLVSAGLYFAYLWPQVEPEEPVGGAPEAKPAGEDSEPAPDQPIEEEPERPGPSTPEEPPGN